MQRHTARGRRLSARAGLFCVLCSRLCSAASSSSAPAALLWLFSLFHSLCLLPRYETTIAGLCGANKARGILALILRFSPALPWAAVASSSPFHLPGTGLPPLRKAPALCSVQSETPRRRPVILPVLIWPLPGSLPGARCSTIPFFPSLPFPFASPPLPPLRPPAVSSRSLPRYDWASPLLLAASSLFKKKASPGTSLLKSLPSTSPLRIGAPSLKSLSPSPSLLALSSQLPSVAPSLPSSASIGCSCSSTRHNGQARVAQCP